MEILKMGSIYLDGILLTPSAVCSANSAISFGDSVWGQELQWVVDGDRLIADRCVAVNMTWAELNRQGYVFGRPVRMEGRTMLCRCPKASTSSKWTSEWDDILKRHGTDDAIWHWQDNAFWGQEDAEDHPGYRSARGRTAPRHWELYHKNDRHIYVGFRPILEPLPPEPELEKLSLGSKVKVYGPSGVAVIGKLAGLDDYDLTLASAKVPSGCGWAGKTRDNAIVNRNDIVFLQKV